MSGEHLHAPAPVGRYAGPSPLEHPVGARVRAHPGLCLGRGAAARPEQAITVIEVHTGRVC